jgi:ferric-dicitrate binding protein FerR (iron transport regulator)
MGPSMRTVQTASNEIKEINLPDGSIAWLNHDSKLEYEEDFSGKVRAIKLNGEAFFEVTKNPEKPFVITSAHSVTTVLGTSFNLTAYDSTEDVMLNVATGRVSFISTKTKEEVIVTANENASITPNGNTIKHDTYDINGLSWKTKKLVFNNASMAEIFKVLEHYFNVKITVTNPLINNCHTSATYENPKLKNVLDDMSKAANFSYTQKGKEIIVSGEGCK